MRLVIDLQGAQTGSRFRGIGRYSLSLAKAIAELRAEHEILIAVSDLFPDTVSSIRAEFAEILPRQNIMVWEAQGPTSEDNPRNSWNRQVSERIREAFLESLSPDIVLITSLFEGFGDDAVSSIGEFSKSFLTSVILYDLIPLLNPDETFRTSSLHKSWYSRKIKSLLNADLLLSISESSRNEALQTGRFNESAVVNISGAYDSSFRRLVIPDADLQELRVRLGISRSFVMYTGGADERKNLHRLIEAYAQLPANVKDTVQLVLVGKMPAGNIDSYLATAKANGVKDSELIFTGYVGDRELLWLYNTCSLFVFPSLHEGFGIPPLEAMACGAPVIAANATSLPEVIGMKEALFDPESVKSISTMIVRALTDESFRERLITHGDEQHKQFSWRRCAERALTALEQLGGRHVRRLDKSLSVDKTACFQKRRLRILVIKLDHFGDFILAIPAISKLRAKYPYATIDAVVGSWNVALANSLNCFGSVFSYDFFKQKSSDLPSKHARALRQLIEQLDRYDVAVDLRRQPDTRFLLASVPADMKIGYKTLDPIVDELLTVSLKQYPDVSSHATPLNKTPISQQMLAVVDAIPSDVNDFVSFPSIGPLAQPRARSVALFPKAGSAVREWSSANFENLANMLVDDARVDEVGVFFANDKEASEFRFLQHTKIKLHIALKLPDLIGELSSHIICVANNSGGVHLASYLGLITFGIYSGHELSMEWGPQYFNSFAIHRAAECSPCHGARRTDCPNDFFCLSSVSVNDVYSRIIDSVVEYDTQSELEGFTTRRQRNTDSIVDALLESIAAIPGRSDEDLSTVAVAISQNHPAYSLSPDLKRFELNKTVDHRSAKIGWRGFSGIEDRFRWTSGQRATMMFECPEGVPSRGIITLGVDTLGKQRIYAKLNGVAAFETTEEGSGVGIRIPVRNLESGMNYLQFELPDARVPGNGDTRQLALAVRNLTVEVDGFEPLDCAFYSEHRSAKIDWRGFSEPEKEFRWTNGTTAEVLFDYAQGFSTSGNLVLGIDTFGPQRIQVSLNGLQIFDSTEDCTKSHLSIRVSSLKYGLNSLSFKLPDAKSPGKGDDRQLALAIRDIKIQVAPRAGSAVTA